MSESKEVLEWINSLAGPIRNFIFDSVDKGVEKYLTPSLAKKQALFTATFYRTLLNKGVPKDLAREIVLVKESNKKLPLDELLKGLPKFTVRRKSA